MMKFNVRMGVGIALLALLFATSFYPTSTTVVAQEDEEETILGVALLFPNSDLFEDYLELTEETTGLAEDEWSAEFDEHVLFVDASTGNGIAGKISNDIGFLDEMFAGTHDFVVYGVFEFPEDHPLNPEDDVIERGVVAYITDDFLVLVLIDLSDDGEITAFAVFPRVENITPLASGINLESVPGIMFLLGNIPQFNIVDMPTPPGEGTPLPGVVNNAACPTDLEKIEDVNVTLTSKRSIAVGSGSSGDLYEISVDSPNILKVESLQEDFGVQAIFNAQGVQRIISLHGDGRNEEIELSEGQNFSLLVGADETRTCVLGSVEASGDDLRITGELFGTE